MNITLSLSLSVSSSSALVENTCIEAVCVKCFIFVRKKKPPHTYIRSKRPHRWLCFLWSLSQTHTRYVYISMYISWESAIRAFTAVLQFPDFQFLNGSGNLQDHKKKKISLISGQKQELDHHMSPSSLIPTLRAGCVVFIPSPPVPKFNFQVTFPLPFQAFLWNLRILCLTEFIFTR